MLPFFFSFLLQSLSTFLDSVLCQNLQERGALLPVLQPSTTHLQTWENQPFNNYKIVNVVDGHDASEESLSLTTCSDCVRQGPCLNSLLIQIVGKSSLSV